MDPSFDGSTPSVDAGFDPPAIFVGFFVLVVVVIAVGIGISIYRAAKVAQSGHNPLTLDNDIAIQALESRALAAERPIEARLAELESLHARGVISADELATARARVLSE